MMRRHNIQIPVLFELYVHDECITGSGYKKVGFQKYIR